MATCTDFIQPLNLKCLLVNTFAGSTEIFTFIAFIAIASMAAFFKMSGQLMLICFILFIVIAVGFLDLGGIYLLTIIIVGLLVFNIIGKLVK